MDADVYKRLLAIGEIEKCRSCLCFFGILKSLSIDFGLDEIRSLLEEVEKRELHDCPECKPCLPTEPYNKIIFLNTKKRRN